MISGIVLGFPCSAVVSFRRMAQLISVPDGELGDSLAVTRKPLTATNCKLNFINLDFAITSARRQEVGHARVPENLDTIHQSRFIGRKAPEWRELCRQQQESSEARIAQQLTPDEGEVRRVWSSVEIQEREKRQDKIAGETGYPRENPPTRSIIRHDSHMRKSGGDPARKRTWFAWVGSELVASSGTMLTYEHPGVARQGIEPGSPRGSHVCSTLSFRRSSILTSITLIGSEELAVTCRHTLFAYSAGKSYDALIKITQMLQRSSKALNKYETADILFPDCFKISIRWVLPTPEDLFCIANAKLLLKAVCCTSAVDVAFRFLASDSARTTVERADEEKNYDVTLLAAAGSVYRTRAMPAGWVASVLQNSVLISVEATWNTDLWEEKQFSECREIGLEASSIEIPIRAQPPVIRKPTVNEMLAPSENNKCRFKHSRKKSDSKSCIWVQPQKYA
ncbi:hypothetical protein PR048_009954 [Dryococelus australis]|uniref:Uncharacterized protein n=1 Tax=Dryococelus australis TaxID=614101 RepID=A0ABQ9I1D8_9NEOP|nr:hypothetical protein PR048_009954 [Dryococelus australis]